MGDTFQAESVSDSERGANAPASATLHTVVAAIYAPLGWASRDWRREPSLDRPSRDTATAVAPCLAAFSAYSSKACWLAIARLVGATIFVA